MRAFILAALMCVLGAAQIAAQGLSIQEQPDTARRYWCTYRSASGAAVSSREVFWTVRKPEVARVVAVPGTSRMRYVYVQALNLDSTVVVCSTIVSGVRYADSVPVKGEQVTKLITVASGWPGAIVVEPPPPPPPADMPNLPAGLSVVADYSGGGVGSGVNEVTMSTSLETDAGAPKSPSDLRRFNIPAITQAQLDSFNNGTLSHLQRGSGYVNVAMPAGGLDEMYIARWLRPSPDLIGDGAGSKSMMLSYGAGTIYFNYETTPDALINPAFTAGTPDPRSDRFLGRNRASTPIVRGTWGLWEFYVKLNTPGVANGIMRVWANGVLQSEYTDWVYRAADDQRKFWSLKSDFYQNRAQLFPMWWDMDHMFVSGR